MNATWTRSNASWLRDVKWGTMTHYITECDANQQHTLSPDDWNRRVDSVDVDRLAERIAGVGSSYHIFTLGQNSGHYCSPNASYDAMVGGPSRLSERDLLGDLATSLGRRNVRTIAYLPSHAPAQHRQAVEALGFTPKWDMSNTGIVPGSYISREGTDERLSNALRNWESVIREWSLRWGKSVSGWWFDGCYNADRLYRYADAPNFQSFAHAAKVGNSESIVAFNPGVLQPVISLTEYEDYTAGELNDLWVGSSYSAQRSPIDGAQLHVLTYLGEWWGRGPIRINTDLAIGYTRHINANGGAVTWDIPISREGTIPDEFLTELGAIGEAISR